MVKSQTNHSHVLHGAVLKNDVPIVQECTINQPSRIRTDVYELNNNTWNTIEWDADNGHINEESFNIHSNLHPYVEQSCLFLGMAGSGKSKILQEEQRILTTNKVFILCKTTCPTHKACKIVNGITWHKLFNVNPIGYSHG